MTNLDDNTWAPDYAGIPEYMCAYYRALLTNPFTGKSALPGALRNAKEAMLIEAVSRGELLEYASCYGRKPRN